MTSPGSSIPDLKKRSKVLYVILGVALVAAVVVIVVVATSGKTDVDDPGPGACKHVEQQAEMGPQPWDEFVESLAKAIEERVKTASGEAVRIHSQRRDDKCTESLRKLEKNLDPKLYQAIARCIADATTARQASKCLPAIR